MRTTSALRQHLVGLGEHRVEVEPAARGDLALAFGQQVQNLPLVLRVLERLDAHEDGGGAASLCNHDRLACPAGAFQCRGGVLAQVGDGDDVGNSCHRYAFTSTPKRTSDEPETQAWPSLASSGDWSRLSTTSRTVLKQLHVLRWTAMAQHFSLPEDVRVSIYKEEAHAVIQQAFNETIADRRLTEEEEQRLAGICKSLDITYTNDADTQRLVERFKLLARIDAGQLPAFGSLNPAPARGSKPPSFPAACMNCER